MELRKNIRLFSRDFLLLLQGHFVSKFGTYLYDISLIFWVKDNTEYASLIGLLLIAAHLPEIILAPIGGALADIISRKKIIVVTDLLGGLLLLLTGLLMTSSVLPVTVILIMLFFVSMMLSVFNSVFNPAVSAFIPQLVSKNKLQEANSLYSVATNSGRLLGQGLSGLLYKLLGAPVLFIVNGLSFLFSSFSESFIKEKRSEEDKKLKLKNSWGDFKNLISEGFDFVKQNIALKRMIILVAVYHFFISPLPMLIPFYVSDSLSVGEEWTGILLALFTAGVISGLALARFIKMELNSIRSILTSGILVSGINFTLLGLFFNPWLNAVSLALVGLVIGVFVVNLQTIIQRVSPEDITGRVFGFFGTLANAAFPLGYGFYGLLMDYFSSVAAQEMVAPLVFIFNGLCLLIFILFVYRLDFSGLFKTKA